MANLKGLKDLAICAARNKAPSDAPAEFQNSVDINETLREEMNALAGDFNSFRRNKLDIFEIIQATADEIAPNKVISIMGIFSTIKQVPDGVRASFTQKVGKQRAKQFLTRVGVSGVYETFRLDTKTFDVYPKAIGGAAYIDFERFLCGDENIMDYMEIIVEGLADAMFEEVQSALQASLTATRPTNTVYSNTYSATELFKLCNICRAYGTGAIIFGSPEFVASMGADAVTVGTTNWATAADLNSIHDTGYVTVFRGSPVVRLPQSFTDVDNATKVVDPRYAYVFPTGGEKVVNIVMEGNTIVKEFENRDNSMELQAYKKFGVAIMTYHNWCVYYNSALS